MLCHVPQITLWRGEQYGVPVHEDEPARRGDHIGGVRLTMGDNEPILTRRDAPGQVLVSPEQNVEVGGVSV